MYLFPRLSTLAVNRRLDDHGAVRHPRADSGFEHGFPETVSFAATGGHRVTPTILAELRSGMVAIARNNGFPSPSNRSTSAAFDEEAAVWLATREYMISGEFQRNDVWAFLSTMVWPDIVAWRFSPEGRERFHGGVRNTFQRLWLRGRLLDRGTNSENRWILLDKLSEDALVQITERPSIAAYPKLARQIAEAWTRALAIHGSPRMETLMRRVILTLRLRNEVLHLDLMAPSELSKFLDLAFSKASQEMNS